MRTVRWYVADTSGSGHFRCFYPQQATSETFKHQTAPLSESRRQLSPHGVEEVTYQMHHDKQVPFDVGVFCGMIGDRDVVFARQIANKAGLVLDCDDLKRHDGGSDYNVGSRTIGDKWTHHYRIAKIADTVTVTTDQLAEEYGAKARVIPNAVPPDWVEDDRELPDRDGRLRLCWSGGLAWKSKDAEILARIVPSLLYRSPRIDLLTVGDMRTHDLIGTPPAQRITVGWTEFPDHRATLDADIGLVPLDDNLFNRCKSYLTGLTYMSRGIPVIATRLPEYEKLIDHGENGYLIEPDKPADWIAAIHHLATDRDELERMSTSALETARAHTTDSTRDAWSAALNGVPKRKEGPRMSVPKKRRGRR